MDSQELKIIMTWQYTLAYHHSHVGMRYDIDNLKSFGKNNAGAGLDSGNGALELTFKQNFPYVSAFVDRILPTLST